MTEQPRLPSDVVEARLNHLIDRARRGALLPGEADQFTTELRDIVRRLEDTEDERDRANKAIRHILGIHPDDRVTTLEAEVARLTAGQCTHAAVPDLRTRGVASLTAAACDGDCGLTEQACRAAHPITRCPAGGVTHIDGPVTTIVDTILDVLYEQPSL